MEPIKADCVDGGTDYITEGWVIVNDFGHVFGSVREPLPDAKAELKIIHIQNFVKCGYRDQDLYSQFIFPTVDAAKEYAETTMKTMLTDLEKTFSNWKNDG